ncbi:DUF6099 family protein [Streptomyces sp. NPDC052020]|uniref:DUF6099 family protein n=1 Tax=Streptomyces sp. NPDC052020 TaxID=3155677 RepID=UPI003416B035
MGIDDRLRDAARAVDEMWSDPEGVAARCEQMRERLSSSQYSSGDSAPSSSRATLLIATCRHALAQSPSTENILTEALEAQALVQAIGAALAATGPANLRSGARGLAEAGSRGCGAIDRDAAVWATRVPRAAMLTGVSDLARTLEALAGLLGDVGIALVEVATRVIDDESVYWRCVEAIDAADESSDLVRGLLRRLVDLDRESLASGAGGS